MKLYTHIDDRNAGDPLPSRVHFSCESEALKALEIVRKFAGFDFFLARIPIYYIAHIEEEVNNENKLALD